MNYRMIFTAAVSATLLAAACAVQAQTSEVPTNVPEIAAATGFAAPADAWRTVDPENLLIISTKYGDIGVELFPEIAPNHVAQVKTLTRQGYYDDVPFHRVIKGFMNQTGDGEKGDGTGSSSLPNIKPEFKFRRSADMAFEGISKKKITQVDSLTQNPLAEINYSLGFYKSLPIASQPTSQTLWTSDNKVEAFGLHCKGVASMARTTDVNGANGQFFLMRGKTESLDQSYSIWGNTVIGYDLVEKPLIGTVGDDPEWIPDRMNQVHIAADLPESERPSVQVLRTDHAAFKGWLETQKSADGTLPEVCDLSVPTRTL